MAAGRRQRGYEGRIGRYGPALAGAFVAAVRPRRGDRVLDVGCGTGPLTAALVAEVGDRARVKAIDTSAEAVRVCRQRLPGVEARVGYAEELPYGDGEFDVTLAQLVVGLLADAPKAVREMRRVTRSEGRVGTCVWDFGGGMTVLRTFWDAAGEVSPGLAREYDQSLTHPYSTAPELGALWRAAGLREVTTGELIAEASYEDFEDLWQPMAVPDGAPGRFLERLSASKRAVVKKTLHQRLGPPRGSFRLQARAWYVLGSA